MVRTVFPKEASSTDKDTHLECLYLYPHIVIYTTHDNFRVNKFSNRSIKVLIQDASWLPPHPMAPSIPLPWRKRWTKMYTVDPPLYGSPSAL